MSLYQSWAKAPGASKKEAQELRKLNASEIIRRCVKTTSSPAVSRVMYYRFINGEDVPEFVRTKIMQMLYEKSQEVRKLSEKLAAK